MIFTVRIHCDNAAFGNDVKDVPSEQCRYEVADILRQLTQWLDTGARYRGRTQVVRSFALRDSNGNTVGHAAFKGE